VNIFIVCLATFLAGSIVLSVLLGNWIPVIIFSIIIGGIPLIGIMLAFILAMIDAKKEEQPWTIEDVRTIMGKEPIINPNFDNKYTKYVDESRFEPPEDETIH
jgi:hypothetical protein